SHRLSIKVYFINIATGDLFGYGYDSNPVDIGKYLILIADKKIVNYNNDDVTSNYEFLESSNEEYLEINTYKVTVKAISQEKEAYDGNPFVYPTASIYNPYTGDEYYKNIPGVEVLSGTFVKDDSIKLYIMYIDVLTGEPVVDEFGRYAPAVNAGQYYIRIYDHEIINAANDNYEVTYVNDDNIILTIGKRTIYYKPRTANNLTYNFDIQEVHPYPTYAGSSDDKALHSLVGNDMFTFDYTITDKNVTELLTIKNAQQYYINAIKESVVFTEGLKSNYEIIFTQGSFRVDPLGITVAYTGNEKNYDAKPLDIYNYHFAVTVNETGDELGLDYNITSMSIRLNSSSIKLQNTVNAGNYVINATKIHFIDESVDNFDITYQSGNYVVNKIKLSVELKDYTFTYNGEAINYDLISTRTITGTIIDNQIIKVHVKFSRLDSIIQDVYLSNENLPVHAGRYAIEYLSYEQCDQFGTLIDDPGLNYIFVYVEENSLVIT
ncbi:MAG: hypothetical protein J6R47_03465, partial [Acholeplasmatales bacterium]|nr:hypothetical protein [Acholeplasmatales bacterium]